MRVRKCYLIGVKRRLKQLYARSHVFRWFVKRRPVRAPRQLQLPPGPVVLELPSGDQIKSRAASLSDLTPSERMVVESLAAGLAPKQIASREGVSVAATRKHIVAAKRKAGARTLAELSALTARADANKFGMTGANVDYSMGQPAPETGHHSPGERLTSRQREVVALLADGLRYREIAQRLDLSERQVGRHVANAIERLGVVSAAELVAVVSVGEELSAVETGATRPSARAPSLSNVTPSERTTVQRLAAGSSQEQPAARKARSFHLWRYLRRRAMFGADEGARARPGR